MRMRMRVLHLPANIASIPSHTVRGQRHIGIDACGIVINSAITSSEGLKTINLTWGWSIKEIWWRMVFAYHLIKGIFWSDVIHWYFTPSLIPFSLDLRLIRILKRPALIEFLGSEIRIPEIESSDNPYYRKAFAQGDEHRKNYIHSRRIQESFAKNDFVPLIHSTVKQYLLADIYPRFYMARRRLMVSDFVPRYPNRTVQRPLVVHAPSNPIVKGTSAVQRAVDRLQKKYDFEFVLIQDMPYRKAQEIIRMADIFLDQFVLGAHGMAALEAMAMGKPVLCYIKPSMMKEYASDFPLVNANQDNLAKVLEPLLIDGNLRHDIGVRSRAYVEKYHDAVKIAHELADIYRELLRKK